MLRLRLAVASTEHHLLVGADRAYAVLHRDLSAIDLNWWQRVIWTEQVALVVTVHILGEILRLTLYVVKSIRAIESVS